MHIVYDYIVGLTFEVQEDVVVVCNDKQQTSDVRKARRIQQRHTDLAACASPPHMPATLSDAGGKSEVSSCCSTRRPLSAARLSIIVRIRLRVREVVALVGAQ